MPKAWRAKNLLKSPLVPRFIHRIKVDICTFPINPNLDSITSTSHLLERLLSSQLAFVILKMSSNIAMNTLNVPIVRWVLKVIMYTGSQWTVSQKANQIVPRVPLCPVCQDHQGLIVSIDQSKSRLYMFIKFKMNFTNRLYLPFIEVVSESLTVCWLVIKRVSDKLPMTSTLHRKHGNFKYLLIHYMDSIYWVHWEIQDDWLYNWVN